MRSHEITVLEKGIGHQFADPGLLDTALTHTSFAHELASRPGNGETVRHNEQLEFLGDAVLGLIASEELYRRFPQYHEGQLSKLRAHLVSERHLIEIARELHLGSYLQLGRGEEKSGGRAKTAVLVDALEAVLGAMYLDGGFEDVRRFIVGRILDPELARNGAAPDGLFPLTDFKSALQERVHTLGRPQPDYVLIKEEGPEHQKTFTVEARIHATGEERSRPDTVTVAAGSTKKKAEQEAARLALQHLDQAAPLAPVAPPEEPPEPERRTIMRRKSAGSRR